jgi:hypothetical protein
LQGPRKHRRDVKTLLWVCGWGGAAAVALAVLAVTSQTESASERLRRIFASAEPAAVAQMPPRIARLESDMQLIAAQVHALTVERDRLAGRIGLLESSIDDMTGTIKRQAAATAAALAAKTPPTPSAPPTTTTTASNPQSTGVTNASTPTPTITAAPKPDTASTGKIPLPPTRLAAAPPNEQEQQAASQGEFGLDLGGATTVDGVRQRWITVKANFGPLLSGMFPLAAREQRPGSTGYRLVVGPLPNSAAASGLCVHFSAARTACRAAKFDGEQIAQH